MTAQPGNYTFDDFLDMLIWRDRTFDEGFPGPEYYSRSQLSQLCLDAIELLDGFQCRGCGEDTNAMDEYYFVNDDIWNTLRRL